jgi:hypothetical protein
MLDAYIIEAIREEELRRERELAESRRIWLELPLPSRDPREHKPEIVDERGPVVIPFSPDIRDMEDNAA